MFKPKRATDEGSLPEIAQYSPYYLPLNVFTASKGSNLYILFKTDRSKAVPLLWFTFIQFILIMSFMLHDFVATRI